MPDMKKRNAASIILSLELSGFILVIITLWLNESIDLPHRLFGAPPTPANVMEALFESAIVVLLAALVVCGTKRLLRRIKRLEGILPICSFCKKIRVGGRWVTIDRYVRDHSEADFSHSVCPECAAQHYSELSKEEGTSPSS